MFPTALGPNIVSVHVRLCVYVCATSLQARMNLFVCFNSVLILTKKYNNCTYGKNKTSNNILDGLYVYLYGTSTITSITVMTCHYKLVSIFQSLSDPARTWWLEEKVAGIHCSSVKPENIKT